MQRAKHVTMFQDAPMTDAPQVFSDQYRFATSSTTTLTQTSTMNGSNSSFNASASLSQSFSYNSDDGIMWHSNRQSTASPFPSNRSSYGDFKGKNDTNFALRSAKSIRQPSNVSESSIPSITSSWMTASQAFTIAQNDSTSHAIAPPPAPKPPQPPTTSHTRSKSQVPSAQLAMSTVDKSVTHGFITILKLCTQQDTFHVNSTIPSTCDSMFFSQTPDVINITDYVWRLVNFLNCESSCLVIAGVLMMRYQQTTGLIDGATHHTVHKMVLAAIVAAIKVHLDGAQPKIAWLAKVGGVSIPEMRAIESAFLNAIKFRTWVSFDDYSKYRCTLLRLDSVERLSALT